MEITMLGTSSMVPTKERNVSSIHLKFKADCFLFDCGEGTQRQMNIANIKRHAVSRVLITHWHGDHTSGLIGLIQTIGNVEGSDESGEMRTLKVYGPIGTEQRMHHLLQSCVFENKVNVEVHELHPDGVTTVIDDDEYLILCAPLQHSTPCIGYAFVEKERRRIDVEKMRALGMDEGPHLKKLQRGESVEYKGKTITAAQVTYVVEQKKFVYIPDTARCAQATALAQDADLLITECTYDEDLQEKAKQFKHLTVKDATDIAVHANAKKLILTHFSPRYGSVFDILEHAKTYFPNVETAFDFMRLKL